MKRTYIAVPLLTLAVVALLSGCAEPVVYVHHPAVVVSQPLVSTAPPAAPPQTMLAAPGPGYVWIPGYWSWSGNWRWVGGRWVIPPYPQSTWVSGYWVHRPQGYVWIRGYWR